MSDVINVGTTPNDGTGDSLRTAMQKINAEMARHFSVCHPPGNAVCDYGVTDDTAAFQAAVNSVTSGSVTIHVPRTAKITGTVTASTGTVIWDFAEGATIVGGGTLPFHSQAMTYNSSPTYGKRESIWNGSSANPSLDGTVPSVWFQRVDATVSGVSDSPSYLLTNVGVSTIREAAGRGYLYGVYSYLEDKSNSGTAQSVALTGVAHANGAANTAVWGVYGEAHARGASNIATGAEFNVYNSSGTDYSYVDATPTTYPFTMGVWTLGGGTKKNTIGYGLGTVGNSSALTNAFRAGIFMQTYSVSEYAIDIQAMPKVGIRFKAGASTDGSHATPGGIGIDFGRNAGYGSGTNQGCMHLWNHRITFGDDGAGNGLGKIYFDGAGKLQFAYNGVNVGYINCASSPDAQINGDIAPASVTASTSTIAAGFGSVIVNYAGTCTLTLPAAASYPGKEIIVRTITANTVVSASSNIVPLAGGAAGTAILAATAGKWALLRSDGTNWQIMAGN